MLCIWIHLGSFEKRTELLTRICQSFQHHWVDLSKSATAIALHLTDLWFNYCPVSDITYWQELKALSLGKSRDFLQVIEWLCKKNKSSNSDKAKQRHVSGWWAKPIVLRLRLPSYQLEWIEVIRCGSGRRGSQMGKLKNVSCKLYAKLSELCWWDSGGGEGVLRDDRLKLLKRPRHSSTNYPHMLCRK